MRHRRYISSATAAKISFRRTGECPHCNQPGDRQPTAQPRKAKRPDLVLILFLGIAIATVIVLVLPMLSNSVTSRQPTAPAPPAAAKPAATLRPPCNSQERVTTELASLLVSLVGTTDLEILERGIALDDDRDGRQMMRIHFQAYKRGTGKYTKGSLYVWLDDITCKILDYDLLW